MANMANLEQITRKIFALLMRKRICYLQGLKVTPNWLKQTSCHNCYIARSKMYQFVLNTACGLKKIFN